MDFGTHIAAIHPSSVARGEREIECAIHVHIHANHAAGHAHHALGDAHHALGSQRRWAASWVPLIPVAELHHAGRPVPAPGRD
jgi:hypothetical protein